MTQDQVEKLLIEAVLTVQELSGREAIDVTPATRPLIDIPEFDSLNGVEVTVDALEAMKITSKFNNVLVDDSKALTIAEAAARLLQCLESHDEQ